MNADNGDSEDWWLRARSISGEVATSVALEAIDNAVMRLQPLRRAEIRQAFVAIAEGTWWVAALDEQLMKRLGGQKSVRAALYRETRYADSDGQFIRGFLCSGLGTGIPTSSGSHPGTTTPHPLLTPTPWPI